RSRPSIAPAPSTGAVCARGPPNDSAGIGWWTTTSASTSGSSRAHTWCEQELPRRRELLARRDGDALVAPLRPRAGVARLRRDPRRRRRHDPVLPAVGGLSAPFRQAHGAGPHVY